LDTTDKIALFLKAYETADSAKAAALVAGIDPTYAWALAKSMGLPTKPRGNLNGGRGRGHPPSPATLEGIAALRTVAETHNLSTLKVAQRVASHFQNIAARKRKAEKAALAAQETAPLAGT